jgi:hypothetical protein
MACYACRVTDERRPSFAREFPRTPELDALVAAFTRGDYAHVRAAAPSFDGAADPAVREAVRVLVLRTKPDPIVLVLLAIATATFAVIAGWSIGK